MLDVDVCLVADVENTLVYCSLVVDLIGIDAYWLALVGTYL